MENDCRLSFAFLLGLTIGGLFASIFVTEQVSKLPSEESKWPSPSHQSFGGNTSKEEFAVKCGGVFHRNTSGVIYSYFCFNAPVMNTISDCEGLSEAIRSASSVVRTSGDVAITLFSNVRGKVLEELRTLPIPLDTEHHFGRQTLFSNIVSWRSRDIVSKELRARPKLQAMYCSPYEHTLFLDTDTLVLEASYLHFAACSLPVLEYQANVLLLESL